MIMLLHDFLGAGVPGGTRTLANPKFLDAIVHPVLNHWRAAKQRISGDRWRKTLGRMREKVFVPRGVALP